MAQRPAYIPILTDSLLVQTDMIDFKFHSGFAVVQKQKSIDELKEKVAGK